MPLSLRAAPERAPIPVSAGQGSAGAPPSREQAGEPLAGGRRARTGGVRTLVPSLVIAGTLALQLLAASRLFCAPRSVAKPLFPRLACAPRLWPFLDYPMYSDAHRAGEALSRDVAVVLFADGRTLRLEPGPGARGLAAGELVRALARQDEQTLLVRLGELVPGAEQRVVELYVERERLVLGRNGFVSSGSSALHLTPLRAERGERP